MSGKVKKKKQATEPSFVKQLRLENRRKRDSCKKAVETESEQQNRLENYRNYQILKKMAESESERQTRLKIDCEYRRKKRANETGVQQQAKKSRTSQELETNVDTNSRPSCSINDSETKNQDNYI
ncbi:Hypothetical predicted protein [Paramuricea clavata]|uniref:Uncharacterized protein n=1 Tax=Paramuricea clavata TaxID=317549 RepID=A0A6S7IIN5_PARCT|nr:Hypothetical predicted protein [Paramuricea clavata]